MTTDIDDKITNPKASLKADDFNHICERRYSRRAILKGTVATGAGLALGSLSGCTPSQDLVAKAEKSVEQGQPVYSNFDFQEVEHGVDLSMQGVMIELS